MTAKIFKPFVCAFIIISLLLGVCFTASAADGNDGHITVDTVTAVNGDMVVVKLTMSENPGIMAMTISVTYDSSVLTYEKFYRGYLRDYTVADHPDENLIRFVNCENGNARNNAVIVSFQFKVKDSAAFGFYPINIEYKQGDFCNWKLEKLMPKITSGGVNIKFNGKNCKHKKYGEWKTAASAGCTEPGIEQRACLKCGHNEMRETAPAGHDFSEEWTVDEPATKEKSGKMSRHCKRCDATTDLLTFSLEDADKNGIGNNADSAVKPSDFTDRLKNEQLPDSGTDSSGNSSGGGTDKTDKNGGGKPSELIPVKSGSALDKIINALPVGIKRLKWVFIVSFFVIARSVLFL